MNERIWAIKHGPSLRPLVLLLNDHAGAKELFLAERLEINIWCKAEGTFCAQRMKTDDQHAQIEKSHYVN